MDLIKISQLRKERFYIIGFDAGIGLSDAPISWGMIEVPEWWGPSTENCILIPGLVILTEKFYYVLVVVEKK